MSQPQRMLLKPYKSMVRWSITQNKQQVGYNAKGELELADHSTNELMDRAYAFDGIGNRLTSETKQDISAEGDAPEWDAVTKSYTSNALNQYSVAGVAARVHDADGNLTDNGEHLYEWDAENRLIAVKQGTVTVAEYDYDYKARRITKTIGSTVTNFVYDGWNPIAEYSGTTLSKSYTWGMDLSGNMQGAGGVGGLLAVNDTAATYYPTFDGNGNVSEYVDATGTSVADYEYDAFGQAVASGTKANDFSHQFSTKLFDVETGLNYYGYRYYDSVTGSWINRDPIEEDGGLNLYGFVRNNGINKWDYLGREFEKFTADASSYPVKYDKKAGSKTGATNVSWNTKIEVTGWLKGFRKIKLSGGMVMESFYHRDDDEIETVKTHERVHVKFWKDEWNEFIKEFNKLENRKFYCKCAPEFKTVLEFTFVQWIQVTKIDDLAFDISSFPQVGSYKTEKALYETKLTKTNSDLAIAHEALRVCRAK
jgi:RHS repeat-associated protein